MLFNSYEFVFLFLPITLAGFLLIGRRWGTEAAFRSLVLASLFFYGWWNPNYLVLIIFSMIFNFLTGEAIGGKWKGRSEGMRKSYLILGVVVNLGLLGYFKYANFFVDNFNTILGYLGMNAVHWARVALPIGISFFTFQKITYSVDVYRKVHAPLKLVSDYALYILMFPQLIAGPIV